MFFTSTSVQTCWVLGCRLEEYHCRHARNGEGGASFSNKVLCCVPPGCDVFVVSPLWQHICMKSWCFGGESSWRIKPRMASFPSGVGPASALGRIQAEKLTLFLWRRQQWPPVVIPLVFCRKVKSCLGGQWKIYEFTGVKASNWVKELLHWTYKSSVKSVTTSEMCGMWHVETLGKGRN